MEQRHLLRSGKSVSARRLTAALQTRSRRPGVTPIPVVPRGDHDLNPDLYCSGSDARVAAVLVPLIARPKGLQVLLTRRSRELSNHAGQIAFPGGCWEPG